MFTAVFIVLFILNLGFSGYAFVKTTKKYSGLPTNDEDTKNSNSYEQGLHESYKNFRNNYIVVYLCMMMADWLQGPYVYALYKSYNYQLDQIGYLFIMGFLSSAIFGTVISSFADK